MSKLKKILIIVSVLLVLGGGVFAFLYTISPTTKTTSLKKIPPHARNIKKGTKIKAKKRRPRPVKKVSPADAGYQKNYKK